MDCLEQMVCFVFVALQGNLKMQNENCKMQILREWFCILHFAVLISHFSMLSRHNNTLRGLRLSSTQSQAGQLKTWCCVEFGFFLFLCRTWMTRNQRFVQCGRVRQQECGELFIAQN